jgi:hypothetical protein
MSSSRLDGVQVWARELSDGSRLVGLLNAGGNTSALDNCTWEHRTGGYYQVVPPTPDGNFRCWSDDTPLEDMKAACCAAGTKQCVSVDHALSGGGGSCAKRNDDGGWVNDSTYEDFVVTSGHPEPVPDPSETICFNWVDVGLNPYQNASVRDVWARQDLGWFATGFCMSAVQPHDVALLRVNQ